LIPFLKGLTRDLPISRYVSFSDNEAQVRYCSLYMFLRSVYEVMEICSPHLSKALRRKGTRDAVS